MSDQPSLAERFEGLADYSSAPQHALRTVQVDGNECFRIAEALRIAEVVKQVAESGRCVLDDGTTIVFQFANSQAVASCILGWAAKRGASADG